MPLHGASQGPDSRLFNAHDAIKFLLPTSPVAGFTPQVACVPCSRPIIIVMTGAYLLLCFRVVQTRDNYVFLLELTNQGSCWSVCLAL